MAKIIVGNKVIINNTLDHILKNKSNLKVLRILNSLKVGISGRETARLSNISLRAAQIALDELESLHLIQKQLGGRENFFNINRENYLIKNIIENLFYEEKKFRTTIFKKITEQLKGLTNSIILFGSTARNEETTNSDLDICIVYTKHKREIEKRVNNIRDDLAIEFGVKLAPFYITHKEFIIKEKKNISPVNNIKGEGKVFSGLSINRLIRG